MMPSEHWIKKSKKYKATYNQDLQQAFEQQDYESAAQWVRHGRFLNKLRNEIASIL